ncbi:MAG: hypothetical protein II444_04095 [Firmicutes bacterium]|nr:hypothetical protein [Bacillota bacterium]
MSWVLYFMGFIIMIGIWDLDTKMKRLLRAQNGSGSVEEGSSSPDDLPLKDLMGKKVKIFVSDDCEIQDCIYFMGHDAVTGEITAFDDTWVEFTFTAPRYEKVPEQREGKEGYKPVPVKNAKVTTYLRISDIDSIDEA